MAIFLLVAFFLGAGVVFGEVISTGFVTVSEAGLTGGGVGDFSTGFSFVAVGITTDVSAPAVSGPSKRVTFSPARVESILIGLSSGFALETRPKTITTIKNDTMADQKSDPTVIPTVSYTHLTLPTN